MNSIYVEHGLSVNWLHDSKAIKRNLALSSIRPFIGYFTTRSFLYTFGQQASFKGAPHSAWENLLNVNTFVEILNTKRLCFSLESILVRELHRTFISSKITLIMCSVVIPGTIKLCSMLLDCIAYELPKVLVSIRSWVLSIHRNYFSSVCYALCLSNVLMMPLTWLWIMPLHPPLACYQLLFIDKDYCNGGLTKCKQEQSPLNHTKSNIHMGALWRNFPFTVR